MNLIMLVTTKKKYYDCMNEKCNFYFISLKWIDKMCRDLLIVEDFLVDEKQAGCENGFLSNRLQMGVVNQLQKLNSILERQGML